MDELPEDTKDQDCYSDPYLIIVMDELPEDTKDQNCYSDPYLIMVIRRMVMKIDLVNLATDKVARRRKRNIKHTGDEQRKVQGRLAKNWLRSVTCELQ